MGHNVVGLQSLRFGIEVRHNPMPEHCWGDGPDIVATDVIAALQHGPRFCGQNQILTRSRAGPPAHIITNHLWHVAVTDARTSGELDRIASQMIGYRYSSHDPRHLDNVL